MKPQHALAGFLAALYTTTFASPLKRQNDCLLDTVMNPSTQQVQASISQWLADVQVVNNFLNNVPDIINNSTILKMQALTASFSANDEPCQLMTLASQPDLMGLAAFDCAVSDLMDVFMIHVIDNLNTVLNNVTDTSAVQTAVDDINTFRCCNVLPDVDILFTDSADENGISNQVPLTVPRENACSTIPCTLKCAPLDNGSNGQVNK